MSDTERRRPRAIDLDPVPASPRADVPDPKRVPPQDRTRDDRARGPADVATPRADASVRRPRAVEADAIRFEPDVFALEAERELETLAVAATPKRRGRWLAIAGSALLGLVGIAFGLWVESLVSRLFALAPWAGFVGLALAILLLFALFVVAARELIGLRRLETRAELRMRSEAARLANDDAAARKIAADLATTFSNRPETARGRQMLEGSARDIMDAADRLALIEQHLLSPLDREARRIVLAGAKRVSIVTAVAPRAFIDIAYVVIENARTVRAVAMLYGVRPGRIGFLKLFKDVIGHLAVTGAIAVGDSVVGEALGHGIVSRISSRFGEGVVNGLLTARLGISAMDLCRPLPFQATPRPTIGGIAGDLARAATTQRADKSLR